VRAADLTGETPRLTTIVGTGLFDFGDVDGTGDAVRLQHPLGVVYHNGLLYVADTYNHKIRRIDPESTETSTFLGSGEDGWRDGGDPLFDEPGGVSIAGDKLYIADTNNHNIRVADLQTGDTGTLVLIDPDGLLTRAADGLPYTGETITLDGQTIAPARRKSTSNVQLPEGYKLNDLAPFSVEWQAGEGITWRRNRFSRRRLPAFPLRVCGDGRARRDQPASRPGDLLLRRSGGKPLPAGAGAPHPPPDHRRYRRRRGHPPTPFPRHPIKKGQRNTEERGGTEKNKNVCTL
jgi:hypothetical protein